MARLSLSMQSIFCTIETQFNIYTLMNFHLFHDVFDDDLVFNKCDDLIVHMTEHNIPNRKFKLSIQDNSFCRRHFEIFFPICHRI